MAKDDVASLRGLWSPVRIECWTNQRPSRSLVHRHAPLARQMLADIRDHRGNYSSEVHPIGWRRYVSSFTVMLCWHAWRQHIRRRGLEEWHTTFTSLLSPRWVNTSSSCWRQTRTPPSRTPALLGLGWIPLDLGAFNLGLIAPVTAQTLGYRSAWSPGTALSHLGSASLVAQGLYSDIGLKT